MLTAARLLALDVGARRIGVAVSDHAGLLAHPLSTLEARGPFRDAEAVAALCSAEEAGGVIVGLPAHADGTESASAARARRLGDALRARGIDVDYQDEWGSSVDGEAALGHVKAGRREKGDVDRAAAVAILTAYLEARRRSAP
ncbi:MAG: Holliday junction resolvase RuvX [Deltaproteobacteria bacterium]|nr:Holliday junction resolvase RuvX [Deltaproteobacteria bacterium]